MTPGRPGQREQHTIATPQLTFAEYDEGAPHRCEACGWAGSGVACAQSQTGKDVVVQCPRCAEALLVVGYPEPPAPVRAPMPRCPWCGSHRIDPLDEDGWFCRTCRKHHPTKAFKCRRPTCWESTFLEDFCSRHAGEQPR